MKTPLRLLSALLLCAPLAPAAVQVEVGAVHFAPRQGKFEPTQPLVRIHEDTTLAPYIAASVGLTPHLGLRFSYQYAGDLEATGEYAIGLPTSGTGLTVPGTVWGHYRDDVHLLSVGPEWRGTIAGPLSFALAPQLNWVASRGTVSYSTDSPVILLIGPQTRREDDFTLGGAARLAWALTPRASVTVGYQYTDIKPSYDRVAHVFSGGFAWSF